MHTKYLFMFLVLCPFIQAMKLKEFTFAPEFLYVIHKDPSMFVHLLPLELVKELVKFKKDVDQQEEIRKSACTLANIVCSLPPDLELLDHLKCHQTELIKICFSQSALDAFIDKIGLHFKLEKDFVQLLIKLALTGHQESRVLSVPIARTTILYPHSEVYFDTDFECLQPEAIVPVT